MKTPTVDEMQAMFRAHTEAAVNAIVDIMTTGTGAKGEAVRLAAAKEILNRAWGRPAGSKGDKDKAAATAKADPPPAPEWRNKDGKTYQQLYAEKEAENKAAAAAAQQSAPPPAPPPPSRPDSARDPDPTGYVARRALAAGPGTATRS